MTVFSRALFIQLRRIGDVLMCTPSIRAFKKAYPKCEIDFLTELPEVLEGNPHLNKIIAVDRQKEYNPIYQFKLINNIYKRHYDIVVDFFANPRSAYYSFLSRAPIRLSYGFGHRRWAYNQVPVRSDTPFYAANDRLNLLKSIGIEESDPTLEFYFLDEDNAFASQLRQIAGEREIITISPVSRREFNRWPLENYAKLADLLAEEYGSIIFILAGPGEEKEAEKVAELMKSGSMVPRMTRLGELGAILSLSSLHIGNDNGPKHIAVARGVPTLTIYGPHSPVSWTYPDPSKHYFISPSDFCPTCKAGRHAKKENCIALIPVDAVLSKARELADISLKALAR